jgi:hypothetical protein
VVEQISIDIIEANVDAGAALQIIASLDESVEASVGRLIYYPYYYYSAVCRVSSLFAKRRINAHCLVDGSRGIAATADRFQITPQLVLATDMLGTNISITDAQRQAARYLSHALGRKTRSIANFEVEIESKGVAYKAFWLAQSGEHEFIVDSVTGCLHTLRKAA